MRFEAFHRSPPHHAPKSLAVRGGLVRTFGGLATFLVLTFFCSGIYILEDAFSDPLAAQAAALIFGAFIIALATILLYYLIRPRTEPRRIRKERPLPAAALPKHEFVDAEEIPLAAPHEDARKDLVYQRVYVDHSRIRP
jgi:hypothetical protein